MSKKEFSESKPAMIILCFRASAIPRPNFPDSGVCQTFVGNYTIFSSMSFDAIDTKFLENKNLEGKTKNNNFHKTCQY